MGTTKTATTWEAQRDLIRSSVSYISRNSGRRAFDCVVIEINRFKEGATARSIVLKTSGCGYPELDMSRVRRLCRRLRRIGVKFNTALPYHQNNGVRGTMFANISTPLNGPQSRAALAAVGAA